MFAENISVEIQQRHIFLSSYNLRWTILQYRSVSSLPRAGLDQSETSMLGMLAISEVDLTRVIFNFYCCLPGLSFYLYLAKAVEEAPHRFAVE